RPVGVCALFERALGERARFAILARLAPAFVPSFLTPPLRGFLLGFGAGRLRRLDAARLLAGVGERVCRPRPSARARSACRRRRRGSDLVSLGQELLSDQLAELLADHPRANLFDLARAQDAQLEGAIGEPDQAVDLEPDRFEHAANLAVLALG